MGSVAKQAQLMLGDNVKVVSAFQNIAATHLQADIAQFEDCDVLVTGNDPEAREQLVQIAQSLGMQTK